MPITLEQIEDAQKQQHAAARDPGKQVRLVAGPGTGKSWAIQEKVLWLLSQGVLPKDVFVVSFTRAAANDLRRRIQSYCEEKGVSSGQRVSVSTLHALGLRALQAANLLTYPADPCVMDNWELKSVVDAEFSKICGYTPGRCMDIRKNYEAFCGTGSWLPPNYIPPSPPISEAERNEYQQYHNVRTQVYSCVLPGEIVRQCVAKIKNGILDPASLLSIGYLVVDEYQDLNPVDLEFIDLLMERGVATFVAGDDDQSIYSFRFASPKGIRTFLTRYAGAADHQLVQCFRCTSRILEAANALMADYSEADRIPKTLVSLYDGAQPPIQGMVHRWALASATSEARAIAKSCNALLAEGVSPRRIMILVSKRRGLLKSIENALDEERVPFETPRPNQYVDSRSGRFAFAMLRVVCNDDDYVAHRLLLGLRPKVGPATCNQIAEAVVANGMNYHDIFHHPLPDGVFKGSGLVAVNHAREVCAVISSWLPEDTLASRTAGVTDIEASVFGEEAASEWLSQVADLPQEMTILELRDYFWASRVDQQEALLQAVHERLGLDVPEGLFPERVRIMTMHGAKGLNASVVFIPGLEENILPGDKRRPYPGLVLEAARLLYTSSTRARAACILSYCQRRLVHGKYARQTPSRFVSSLGGPFTACDDRGLCEDEVEEIVAVCRNL